MVAAQVVWLPLELPLDHRRMLAQPRVERAGELDLALEGIVPDEVKDERFAQLMEVAQAVDEAG